MRVKAVECEALSTTAKDAGVVRRYTALARQWRELADLIEARSVKRYQGLPPECLQVL